MSVLVSPAGDAVSDALRSLQVRSSVFCLSDLRAPWAFRVDGADVAKFHLVLEGSAWIKLDGRAAMPVAAGDLVVLPRGQAHAIYDDPRSPVVALERVAREHASADSSHVQYGGSGARTRLLCGGFSVAGAVPDATLAVVLDMVRVDRVSVAVSRWLEPMLAMLNSEAEEGRPGSSAVLAKIADVFLTQALRAWLVGAEEAGLPVTGQLRDRPIAEAVQAIRSRPGEPWTLGLFASPG